VVILGAAAVPACPVVSGRPDTYRAHIGSRSRLGAIAVRHTGGKDAAWHGPRETGAASVQAHQGSSGTMLLWDHQGARCPSPARDAFRYAGRAVRLVCTRMRHRHGGPRGAVWLQANGWLVPIPEHRGQQLRRLAFGQPCLSRNAELAQECRLFLGGGVLAPRGLRFHEACYPEVPCIVLC
jgi:hypothetical protein